MGKAIEETILQSFFLVMDKESMDRLSSSLPHYIHSYAKWALVHEFKDAGFSLLHDSVTNGTCSHVVPLLETSVNTVVSLDHILGKVVFFDLKSMPGIVFAANFPNTLEKF